MKKLYVALLIAITSFGGCSFLESDEDTVVVEPVERGVERGEVEVVAEEEKVLKMIYSEKIDEVKGESRSFPVLSLHRMEVDGESEALIDSIGGLDEYPTGFNISPDKDFMLINLEKRLMKLDLETKELSEIFVPQRQVMNYMFIEKGAKLLIWDQVYAGEGKEYTVHEYDFANGDSKVLHEGEAGEGEYYFMSRLREDGKLLLIKAHGEAGLPAFMDLETGDIKKLLEEPVLFASYSNKGEHLVLPSKQTEDKCNEFMGGGPSHYEVMAIEGDDEVSEFGIEGFVIDTFMFKLDNSEVIMKAFKPMEDVEGEDDCKNFVQEFKYYRQEIGEDPKLVADGEALISEWHKDIVLLEVRYSEKGLEYLHRGEIVFRPSEGQSLMGGYF